ncbi:estradiol 17-beta-dehydrogenase 12-A-like, partial [Scleropages formosus]
SVLLFVIAPPLLLSRAASVLPEISNLLRLARRGFAVMLISRSQEKLDDVSRSLGASTRTLLWFSNCPPLVIRHQRAAGGIRGNSAATRPPPAERRSPSAIRSDVSWNNAIGQGSAAARCVTSIVVPAARVNNVGISYPYPEYFLNIPNLNNFVNTVINVNITSVCQMTRLVLPKMVERSKGVILNISSASGMYPVPLLTIYSATKASQCDTHPAFVDYFSRGVHAEYKSKGIIVQSVLPFFVATKMTKIRKPTLDKPTPERYVSAQLNTVGLQSQTNGYFPHAVMGWFTTILVPVNVVIYFAMQMHKAQRAGYLRRRLDYGLPRPCLGQ